MYTEEKHFSGNLPRSGTGRVTRMRKMFSLCSFVIVVLGDEGENIEVENGKIILW
ncbi:hypothetical protein [Deferribacter autotrophicus]|uniref:hypothetical protein n=1 Tax=Deferribacter autotrophicus TaxID=500465 RepID=UPI00165E16C3|nr:hypothetical protein [Deferribacter autotrophicus]